tara:strand:+ start:67 stop:750 length:684 start_codon:yes stop_codon:yes gene_type:complete
MVKWFSNVANRRYLPITGKQPNKSFEIVGFFPAIPADYRKPAIITNPGDEKMPRKAPDGKGVVEHRLTLGNYERTQLDELANAKKTQLYLQPFQSVLPVALAGGAGYLGLAYMMDWWPFKGPSYVLGLAYADKAVYGAYTDVAGEKGDEYIAKKLKEIDDRYAVSQSYLTENPTAPSGMFGAMQWKTHSMIVATYAERRQNAVNSFARAQQNAAEKAADFAAKSDAV